MYTTFLRRFQFRKHESTSVLIFLPFIVHSILIDINGFWTYENRENTVHALPVPVEEEDEDEEEELEPPGNSPHCPPTPSSRGGGAVSMESSMMGKEKASARAPEVDALAALLDGL